MQQCLLCQQLISWSKNSHNVFHDPPSGPKKNMPILPRKLPVLLVVLAWMMAATPLIVLTECLPIPGEESAIATSPGTLLIPLTRLVHSNHWTKNLEKRKSAITTMTTKETTPDNESSSTATTATTTQQQAPSAATVSVATIGRVGYVGHILIGTPPQRFPVLFDTGSDLALVISDHCQGYECPDLLKYSCSTSSTCVDLGGDGVNRGVGAAKTSFQAQRDSMGQEITARRAETRANTTGARYQLLEDGIEPWSQQPERKTISTSPATPGSAPGPAQAMSEIGSCIQQLLGMQSSETRLPSTSSFMSPISKSDNSLQQVNDSANEPRFLQKHADKTNPETSYIPSGPSPQHSDSTNAGATITTGSTDSPWTMFYNQSYVDGSWGAGTFVQDIIQIEISPSSSRDDLPKNMSPAYDTFQRGPHLASVTFLSVVQDQLGLVQGYDGQISGLLGLTRASPTGRKTFLQELVEQNSLALPVVSMHLSNNNNKEGESSSSFLLGAVDYDAFLGELVYAPVTDPVTWQISLQGLGTRYRKPVITEGETTTTTTIAAEAANSSSTELPPHATDSNSNKINNNNNNNNNNEYSYPRMMPQFNVFQGAALILDSGTSSILIPTAASEAIHRELHGVWDTTHSAWFLPCQGGPDLVWWISSGHHGIVQPYDTLIYPLEDGRCQSLIFGNPEAAAAEYWILGDTWLRGLYVVYDTQQSGRIGLAAAKADYNESSSSSSSSTSTGTVTGGRERGSGGGEEIWSTNARILHYHNPNHAARQGIGGFLLGREHNNNNAGMAVVLTTISYYIVMSILVFI